MTSPVSTFLAAMAVAILAEPARAHSEVQWPPAALPRAELLLDLEQLERDYVLASASFGGRSREQASERIAELRSHAGALQPLHFFLSVAAIAALADNAHDAAFAMSGAWQPKMRLPMRMIWFSDGLTISRVPKEHRDLAGAQIVSIDGHDLADVMEKLRPYQGGPDEYRRWALTWALTSPEVLHAVGIAERSDLVVFRLKLRNGNNVERRVMGVPVMELPKPTRQQALWYATPLPGEAERGWSAAASGAPLYLQEPEKWFRTTELPQLEALYVQFRSNMDEGESKIEPFVARVAERLRDTPPRNLILDLRFDTGGDNTKNRDLMREIARRVPGRIYVILSNYTFSAGIASAAALKHDGGDRVTLVGEPVGDRLRWWSEHKGMVCLTHSQVCVSPNHGLWDIERGCKGETHCFGDQFDLNVRSLRPSLVAPVTSADWLEGRDPAMELIARDLLRTSQPDLGGVGECPLSTHTDIRRLSRLSTR